MFKISGSDSAGSLFLLDSHFTKHSVGIVAPAQGGKTAPLIDAAYYLTKALEHDADLTVDNIHTLISKKLPVIILPDIAAMPGDTLNTLEKWVKDGGVLIRFAGPNMSEHTQDNYLLPVKLHAGERAMSGAMSWGKPQKLAPFPESSPLYGLMIDDQITVTKQMLADPAQALDGKIWASLSDGTPLITGAPMERGLVVLIHTTADPSWSDLPLSGLYVRILQRLISMASADNSAANIKTDQVNLDPLLILDGKGNLITPPPTALPLETTQIGKITPGSQHPPGLYGNALKSHALNLGDTLPDLKTLEHVPPGVTLDTYDKDYEIDIGRYFLYAALLLFCLDWFISMVLSINLSSTFLGKFLKPRRSISVFIALSFLCAPGLCEASTDMDIKYASSLYLAYIKTGNTHIDSTTHKGLESLSETLIQRTSVEPEGVVALDPERDTLIFFPLIYWAISETQSELSAKALNNIQDYLDHGGTILFDTRDGSIRADGSPSNTQNAIMLRKITSSLNIPPIAPIGPDHVMGRSFYLLESYPGRYDNGTIWLEEQTAKGRDGVSSVIIGSNDWSSAWASAHNNAQNQVFLGNTSGRKNEIAMRVGVNLVMYALTGNYKADQVHIPHILERLER